MKTKEFFKMLGKHRNIEDIDIKEVNDIMVINKDAILLDVRSVQEYTEEHLTRSYKYIII